MNNNKIYSLNVDADGFNKERERIHRAMLSSVSHDLKTPLASIIGSLEIYERMKSRLPPEKLSMLISTALGESYRLDNFITNILDISRLENGMVKVHYKECDIGLLLKDCIASSGRRLRESDISVVSLSGILNVHTDATLLCRAISLLLDNAVKYSGVAPVIRIEYGRKERTCFINISDNGPGFPDMHSETIFSKYARLHKEDRQSAGTGLGLSICREIMQLLHGSVFAANQPQGGSIFTLQFPVD